MKPRRHARSTKAQQRKLFPIPVGADQDQVVALGDPGASPQRQDLLAVESPGMGEVDRFERRRIAQLGGVQPPLKLALLAGRPLGVDQQAEPLLEAEGGGLVGLELFLDGVGHRAQLHGVELVEGLFDQHRSSFVVVAAA